MPRCGGFKTMIHFAATLKSGSVRKSPDDLTGARGSTL